jgi:PleD family two-component response regulator
MRNAMEDTWVSKEIRRILLVDADVPDARLLREILSETTSKTTVTHVRSMQDAESYLARATADVILLEPASVGTDQLEAVRKVHSIAARVPVVVLTRSDDELLSVKALLEGVQDYLIKGELNGRELLRALRHAIQRNSMEAALLIEKERAETTLNSIGEAVVRTDPQGTITFLNAVAEKLSGWSLQDAVGRSIEEVFRIVDAERRQAVSIPIDLASQRD